MFEQLTYRARRVVVLGQEEARSFNHSDLGTEHLLLGLLRLREGMAAAVFDTVGVSIDSARSQVISSVGASKQPHTPTHTGDVHLRFTSRAKQGLELSLAERTRLGHREVDAEHLLLGLLRAQGMATDVLSALGVDPAVVRDRTIEALQQSLNANE